MPNNKPIDLRSDTVTKPCDAMRAQIASADVGDDVYGEDPTVNKLQDYVAKLLGKEAALFCPSGTQSNLLAILSHCGRGDEYIVGQVAHTYMYEGGGAAVLGSVQPQPLDFESPGVMPLDKIRGAIKPLDPHFARTKLICLENTQYGTPLPYGYSSDVKAIADEHGLAMHLDGARLFNAHMASGEPLKSLAADFDSISICLSKGLGAPVGSVLVGSSELIEIANRWRKVVGGGMRQAGMMAAGGLFALENNVKRLADDHDNARYLGDALNRFKGIKVGPTSGDTNMVYVSIPDDKRAEIIELAKMQNITLPSDERFRMVIHKDVDRTDLDRVILVFQAIVG
jgi:threonine aldolase